MKIQNIKRFCSVCGALYFDNKKKYCFECKMKLSKVKSLSHKSNSNKSSNESYVLRLFTEVQE